MNNLIKPLGKIRELVLETGLDISYAYDDLVFSEHSVFVLRFNELIPEKIHVYFNSDCIPEEAADIEKKLINAFKSGGFEPEVSGLFELKQIPDKEEIEIKFL